MVIMPPIETSGVSTDQDINNLIHTVRQKIARELEYGNCSELATD